MKTCTSCKKTRPHDEFWPDKRRKSGLMARCKECRVADTRAYRAARPSYEKDRYQRDKEKARERHLKRKYGVSLDVYTSMLKEQNGCCAICGSLESEQFNGVFNVDHCHATGAVRGLLCRGCNHMLGVVGDNPEILRRAIGYLASSRKSRPSSSPPTPKPEG